MTAQESIALLKKLQETGLYYARQSQMGRNTDPLHDTSTALWVRQFTELGFESGQLGSEVANARTSWKAWAERFTGAVKDLLAYRQTFGFDGHEVKVVDSGVRVSGGDLYVGGTTDDPMQGWWLDFAAPTLDSMAVGDAITWVTTPFREGAAAVEDVLDYAPVVAVFVIVVLVLILAVNITG